MSFIRFFAGALLAAAPFLYAQAPLPGPYGVPPSDAPELAGLGEYGVGVRTLELVDPDRPDILRFDEASGKAPLYDRPLTVEVWYPAVIPAGAEQATVYESALPGSGRDGAPPKTFRFAGKALRDAEPAMGAERFPLVLVSHGYPGSRTFLSYLTENLASKGYVVAAIDHTDSVFGARRGFQSTLMNRVYDQLFVIAELGRLAEAGNPFISGALDASRVALVGYSMGGYGALAAAGAGYSKAGTAARLVPGGYFDALTAGDPRFESLPRENIRAVVAIAPWGAQAPHRNWDDEGLKGLRVPTLFIVGDHDDVSGYEDGVARLFEKTVNAERWMLVYKNARHNVGGNPSPPEAGGDFRTRESFDEPVWRKDRVTAINQHFATAFLDLHLKGDESRREYLDVSFEESNDGKWPLPPGQSVGGAYSEGGEYWKGFQRRWALGLEMRRLKP